MRVQRCFYHLLFLTLIVTFIIHGMPYLFVDGFWAARPRVSLLVAILSAGIRADRRAAIRATWLQECRGHAVACKFFTDEQDISEALLHQLVLERSLYNDLEFIRTSPGRNFGLRLLRMMQWALRRYEFDFFLRVDDDQFVCLERLLNEVPFRPKTQLYWGFFYCREGIVRADEGFTILTSDLVKYFVANEGELLCSPHADQQLAIWMKDFPNAEFFYDNDRVIHNVSILHKTLSEENEICRTYLSIHGTYPSEMAQYWRVFKSEKKTPYTIPKIQNFSQVCSQTRYFHWESFKVDFRFEPRPCRLNPTWDEPNSTTAHIKKGIYVGRSGRV